MIFSEIMAGTNLYLIRNNNLTWAKYSNVVDVFLSTKETPYASVAGVASTNVVTITGATLVDGMVVVFPTLTGGSGIAAGAPYYTVNSSGSTCKLAQTPGGSVVGLGTDITDGTAEFKDRNDVVSSLATAPIEFNQTTGIHPEVSHDLRAETGSVGWRDIHAQTDSAQGNLWAGQHWQTPNWKGKSNARNGQT